MIENFREILRNSKISEVKKLHGDASYRQYFRIYLENEPSLIAMVMLDGKASASEEITNYDGGISELPFINIDKYLSSIGILVPKIVLYDEKKKILFLEDLGDHLMAKSLDSSTPIARETLYTDAIDMLVRLQAGAKDKPSDTCIAFKRSFDATLLNWEFDHFLEYGIEARIGKEVDSSDRIIFEDVTRKISKQIVSLEYGFTHRDYQSRNIIIKDGDYYLIDFQDALMGPFVYDLVSLLRDSYSEISDDVLNRLIGNYSESSRMDADRAKRAFNLVCVQRKLKDAGRFVYIDRVKGNPSYLKFIPRSLGYVRNSLVELDEYGEILSLIEKYLPEWK